jgi:hypothetical protein
MKRIKKIIASTMIIAFVTGCGLATIILYPQPMFAHKLQYKNFSVYSNDKIENDICAIIDATNLLIAQSELHDPVYQYDLFLSHNTFYNKVDNLLGSIQAARATGNNIVIKVRTDIENNQAFSERSTINLTQLVAHEMIHCLQAHKYGKLKFNPWNHPPMWKLEGYAEYISRKQMLGKDASCLSVEIERYLELKKKSVDGWIEVSEQHFVPDIYYKGRLMITYLMDESGNTYDQILLDATPESVVYNNMIAWHKCDDKPRL